MASVNKAIIVGNLGADPELKYMSSGDPVCNFSIATTKRWTDKDGEKQEGTEWHRIVLWKRNAEIAKEYLHKGSCVYIEGKITSRSYEDKDGNKVNITEIVGDRIQFMDPKPDSDKKQSRSEPGNDPDLPF